MSRGDVVETFQLWSGNRYIYGKFTFRMLPLVIHSCTLCIDPQTRTIQLASFPRPLHRWLAYILPTYNDYVTNYMVSLSVSSCITRCRIFVLADTTAVLPSILPGQKLNPAVPFDLAPTATAIPPSREPPLILLSTVTAACLVMVVLVTVVILCLLICAIRKRRRSLDIPTGVLSACSGCWLS